jgi:hypothetical protein
MRIFKISLCVAALVASGTAFAVNPPPSDSGGLILHSTLGVFTGRGSDLTPPVGDILPGQTLSITGDCVTEVVSVDELRVVLTLTEAAGNDPGYRSVVAIDQAMHGDALQVRVPNIPESANRIFQVSVFMLRDPTPEMCRAGSIRIGQSEAGKFG